MANKIGIALGSNLGQRNKNIQTAIELLERKTIVPIRQSSLYETEPLGFESKNRFLNAVVLCETELPPHKVLGTLLEIEQDMGRTRSAEGYSDRIIDLDLLFSDALIIHESNLILPHPKMQERLFVLEPLVEIHPEWNHPLLGISALEMLQKIK
jgi:2-amino-4-hydroxy-6-hydroxymethyldihydropteridine diphosphokinase